MASDAIITAYIKEERYPLFYCLNTLVRIFVYLEDGRVLGQQYWIETGNTLNRRRFIN